MGKQKEAIYLSQRESLTLNIFVNLELQLKFLVQEEQEEEGSLTWSNCVRREEGRRIGLRKILSKRKKGERELDLE